MAIVPLFMEQPRNARLAEDKGAAISVAVKSPIEAAELEPKLRAALGKMLGSPSYKEAALNISRVMRAQRWTPAEKAASVSLLPVLEPPVHLTCSSLCRSKCRVHTQLMGILHEAACP